MSETIGNGLVDFLFNTLIVWTIVTYYYSYKYTIDIPDQNGQLKDSTFGNVNFAKWASERRRLTATEISQKSLYNERNPSLNKWKRKTCETCSIENISFNIPNEARCSGQGVNVIYLINSHPRNGMKRQAIRNTWGAKQHLQALNMSYVFMLGRTSNNSQNEMILNESNIHGDIVQSTMEDTYTNLNIKTISGLQWTLSYCSHASGIFKTDDDIVINVFSINELMEKQKLHSKSTILGNCFGSGYVHRNPLSKWYASYKIYPYNYYGSFCLGSALIMSTNSGKQLLQSTRNTHYFNVEDVYISALAASKADLKRVQINGLYMRKVNMIETPLAIASLVSEISDMYTVWNQVKIQH